jgi:hypothetical protein
MNHYYIIIDGMAHAIVVSVAAFPLLYDFLAEKFV